MTTTNLSGAILNIIETIGKTPFKPSQWREIALTKTKLQEAYFWATEAEIFE